MPGIHQATGKVLRDLAEDLLLPPRLGAPISPRTRTREMNMRAHYFQHVPFEGLGVIEPWLQAAGYQISRTCFYQPHELPRLAALDLLIVLGGPMSVNDEDSLPWLTAEKAFIRQAIAANKPILGICLGAQLIANACNCRVSPNPLKEIGWFPITAVAHEQPALFAFPPELTVLQWHGETFELPPQAQQLARSQACEQQAFQLIGKPVIGLQFHLETTASSLQSLMGNCAEELVVAPYIQSAESLRATPASQYRLVNEVMAKLLNYLTQWPHI